MRIFLAGLVTVTCLSAWVVAQPAAPPEPKATITLKDRQASASPERKGFTHTGGGNLTINDRRGPLTASVGAGDYRLRQTFAVTASHPRSAKLCKAASAEFAPDPALDPLWISYWEPFHGAAKKDFGFQVILKVAPE